MTAESEDPGVPEAPETVVEMRDGVENVSPVETAFPSVEDSVVETIEETEVTVISSEPQIEEIPDTVAVESSESNQRREEEDVSLSLQRAAG